MNNKYKKMAFGIMYSIGLLYSAGRFIYWNLDNQYGDGYTIRECLEANSKIAFNALNNAKEKALAGTSFAAMLDNIAEVNKELFTTGSLV